MSLDTLVFVKVIVDMIVTGSKSCDVKQCMIIDHIFAGYQPDRRFMKT